MIPDEDTPEQSQSSFGVPVSGSGFPNLEVPSELGDTEKTSRQVRMQAKFQVTQWQGQFPPPEAVEVYERLHPGAFDRMLTMAEYAQASQVASVEAVNQNIKADAQRGSYLGAAVTVLAMAGAFACAYIGQPWVATAFIGVPVISVARSLIETSRKS